MVENDQTGQMKRTISNYCFENLIVFLQSSGKTMNPPPQHLNEHKYPLFVTWLKNGNLRGCIGTFSDDLLLGETLQKYSLIAAVQDSRFPPISQSELAELRVEISLLNSFEEIKDALDWQVGTHGVEIEFKNPASK